MRPERVVRSFRTFLRLLGEGRFSEIWRQAKRHLADAQFLAKRRLNCAQRQRQRWNQDDSRAELKIIAELEAQISRLDIEHAEIASKFDSTYAVNCFRRDASEPYYKYIDVFHCMSVWRTRSIIDHITKKSSQDSGQDERITAAMRHRFLARGVQEIFERTNPARYPKGTVITLTDEHIDAVLDAVRQRPTDAKLSPWQELFRRKVDLTDISRDPIIPAIQTTLTPGLEVLCYGSVVPYFECLCLEKGARPITASPIIRYDSERLRAIQPVQIERYQQQFDVAIASLAIGRAGLGIYGEEIDPDGDLAAMELMRRTLRPDGRLLATFYVGPPVVLYNGQRIYDEPGLARLFQGWSIVEERRLDRAIFPIPSMTEEQMLEGYHPHLAGFVLAKVPQ